MMDFFNNTMNLTNSITQECRDWCLDQHYIFEHNDIVKLVQLVIAGGLLILLGLELIDDKNKSLLNLIPFFKEMPLSVKLSRAKTLIHVGLFFWVAFVLYIFYQVKFGYLGV